MEFTGIQIDLQLFKSKEEAIKILKENGEDYQALMLIANEYYGVFGKELTWHNPLFSTDYAGVHIVAVREGFLCIPYGHMDVDDHELFDVDRAYMLNAETAEIMLNEWKSYSEDFIGAMNDMIRIIKQK